MGRIALTGVVILDDDPPARIRWQAENRKRYLDQAFRRDSFRRDFAAAHGSPLTSSRHPGRITERLRILEEYRTLERSDLLADRVRMSDLKYTFQTAIGACIDAAHHLIADQGLGIPSSNGDAFRRLGEAGVISSELATTMAGAVGLRNILVHGYAGVGDGKVIDHLAHLDSLRSYVGALSALLDDTKG